jgi:hypothetical protein
VRPDGFHDLRTIFQSLALHDVMTFTARKGPFAIRCDDPDIPTDGRNLIWRAASLLWRAAGRRGDRPRDAVVNLRKRIPVEAGLGGGSANAAMAILGLARTWQARDGRADNQPAGRRRGRGRAVFSRRGEPRSVSVAAMTFIRWSICRARTSCSCAPNSASRPPRRTAGTTTSRACDGGRRRRKPLPEKLARLGGHPAKRPRARSHPPPSDDWPDPPGVARCGCGRRGDVRVRLDGVWVVRAARRRAPHRRGPGAPGLAGRAHPHVVARGIRPAAPTRACRRTQASYKLGVCPLQMGRGQVVRRGSLDPVFEGSNPSAPTNI